MKAKTQFVICVKNEDYPASLQLWKVYRVLADEKAERRNLLRVVDESGEDYLFSASYFVPVDLPQAAKAALLAVA
jgi:hypothetical protein